MMSRIVIMLSMVGLMALPVTSAYAGCKSGVCSLSNKSTKSVVKTAAVRANTKTKKCKKRKKRKSCRRRGCRRRSQAVKVAAVYAKKGRCSGGSCRR